MLFRCFFFVVLAGAILSARAEPGARQDLQILRQTVHEHASRYLATIYGESKLAEDVEIAVATLDARLRLDHCEEALQLETNAPNPEGRHFSVRVHCPSASRWAIIVPVHYDLFEIVATAARDLQRGERIDARDVLFRRTNTAQISRYLVDQASVLGKELKRPLRLGTIIKASDLQEPKYVNRGDVVKLIAQTGNLLVSSEGTALTDGLLGEQIRVRNEKSRRIVDARVSGPGEARVSAF